MGLFKILNPGESLRGKVCKVQWQDGHMIEYLNLWQFVNCLRGKSFLIQPSRPFPDLETFRNRVAANPNDARARMGLGARLVTAGSLDAGYMEYLEAIALLSRALVGVEEARILAARGFAHSQAARILEQMGRNAEARQHWQGCADDLRAATPQEQYLQENPCYLEALEKLSSSSTE